MHRREQTRVRVSAAAKDAYWSQIVGIQHQVVTAWQLYAEGKCDEALAMMSAASDAEDKTRKTPGDTRPDGSGARTLWDHVA